MKLSSKQHGTGIKNIKPLSLFLFVTLFTLVVRVGSFLWNGYDVLTQTPFSDEVSYYLPSAQSIIDNGVDFFWSHRALWNGPLNPLWIAVFQKNIPLIKLANILLFSISIGVCAVGISIAFTMQAAILFSVGMLLFAPTYDFISTILTEPLFCSFLILSLGVVLFDFKNVKQWMWGGVLLGIATLARPTTQFLPFVFIGVGIYFRLKKNSNQYLGYGLSALLTIMPFLLNNYLTFGKVGLANGFGAVLYLGNDLRTDGDEPVYSGVDFDTQMHTAPYMHLETEGDKKLTKIAQKRIEQHPVDSVLLIVRKTFRYMFGSARAYFYPYQDATELFKNTTLKDSLIRVSTPLLLSIAWIFGMLGLFVRTPRPEIRIIQNFLGIIIIYFVALHALAFPIPRLALPVFPFVLLLSMIGYQFSKKRTHYFGWALIGIIVLKILLFSEARAPTEVSDSYLNYFDKKITGTVTGTNDISKDKSGQIVKGSDPFFLVAFPEVTTRRNQVVAYRVKTECSRSKEKESIAQLFWQTDQNPNFSESCSMKHPIKTSSRTIIVRPALHECWTGTLNALRVDLPSEFNGCRVRLESVQVLE